MAAADQEARFAVDLSVTGADKAQDLGQALASLRDKIKADQAAINELQSAMRRLQGGSAVNVAVMKQLRDQLAAKRASLAAAQESYVKLGGTFGDLRNAARATGAGLDDLLGVAQGAGGPVGGLAGRVSQLRGLLGKAGAAGAAVVLAAALLAIVAGSVVATAALAAFALQAASAAREAQLLFDAVSAGAGADQRLGVQVELLAGRVALARSQLNEMALALGRTRLQGRSLEAAFSAVATATAVMGQAAGGVLQGIATEAARTRVFVLNAFSLDGTGLKVADVGKALAKRMGVSFQTAMAAIHNGRVRVEEGLKALDDAVQAKFGKIAKAQLLGFGAQLQRTKENIGALFKDVKIEPALRGLRGVLRLFDQSTVTGQQLKFIVETLLNPLFEAVARVSPYVQGFFKGMVIAVLVVTLLFVRAKRALEGAFGSESKSKIDGVKVGVYAGIAAVALLIGSIAALAVMVAVLATPLVAPFIALGAAVLMMSLPFVVAGAAVYGLYLAVVAAYRAIAAVDFAEVGARLVDGLVAGLRSGISRVVSAVKELGASATAALSSIWKVASPSKVGFEKGAFYGEGVELGIESRTAGVDVASQGLAEAATGAKGSGTGRGASKAQRGGGNTYHIVINGVKDADELTGRTFLARLVAELEGAAVTGGIPLEPEPA
ncbi:hypothetical protein [Sorangium sp. So ce406]|uniref:hypothetical protein n=1 Tax=Sorangium sp. So ce406 TaxID=3133311 RepID=UPI003F5C568C